MLSLFYLHRYVICTGHALSEAGEEHYRVPC